MEEAEVVIPISTEPIEINTPTNSHKRSNRNSLLEPLRLCASLWVMYYHGYSLITKTSAFGNGRIAVDFFFILSGFFFLNSFKKHVENKQGGVLAFIWQRFKPLFPTTAICLIFSLLYFFHNGMDGSFYGYLWYVPRLMDTLLIYFLLRKYIKNDKIFYIVVAIISATCYALILTYVTRGGIFRGLAGIGMGILISLIPKIKFKRSNLFCLIVFLCIFASIAIMAYFSVPKYIQDPICLLGLFPAIIYFANNVKFSSKIVNVICEISFGLYAYQTVPRYSQKVLNIPDGWEMALLVISLATIDLVVKKSIEQKKKAIATPNCDRKANVGKI